MTVLERLEQIRYQDALIDSMLEQERRLREMATSITAPIGDGMPHSSSVEKDKIGIIAAKIVDLQQEYNAEVDRYVDMKNDIIDAVRLLPADEKAVIEQHYFHHVSLSKIAKQMHYSRRNVYYLRDRAIVSLEKLLK